MNVSEIGQFIKNKRIERKLTQAELAETFNISPQAVSKWERSESLPDIGILSKLSNVLGTTVEELLNGGKKSEETNLEDRLSVMNAFIDEEMFNHIISKFDNADNIEDIDLSFDIFLILNNMQKDELLEILLEIEDYYLILDYIIHYLNNNQRLVIINDLLAKADYESINNLIPFLNKTTKTLIILDLLEKEAFAPLEDLLVFFDKGQKNIILEYIMEKSINSDILENIIPFLDVEQRTVVRAYLESLN